MRHEETSPYRSFSPQSGQAGVSLRLKVWPLTVSINIIRTKHSLPAA
jgi:hypothetical protein